MRHVVKSTESLFPLMEGHAPGTVPYQPHSATSRAAAAAVRPKAGSQRGRVLAYLESRGAQGATDHEGIRDMQQEMPTAANAYRARRIELADAGLVVQSPGKRISPAGLPCDVWVAKEYEQEAKTLGRSA